MATNTYVALDKVTVGTATPTITFTSIPQGYTDLVLEVVGNVSANAYTKLYFNGVTTATYSATQLYGDGSSAGSSRQTTGSGLGYIQFNYLYTASNQGSARINIQNYSNSTTYKTCIIREDDAAYNAIARVGLWQSTNAITSVTVERVSGNWSTGTTASLYGIAADTNAYTAKATGGTITSDTGYVYHTFTSSGTFTPTTSLNADILVIAGGGGSLANGTGAGPTGGGGAGGVLGFTSQSLTATGYTVTVGAGGANVTGNDSQFGALTLVKGGGRGGATDEIGATGGSGGGSGGRYTSAGGSATSGQGYAGGVGYQQSGLASGGGGGAGQLGWGAASNAGGYGGNGTNAYSVWATATNTGVSGYYAGGGGGMSWYSGTGGVGGAGGGGNGANTSTTGSPTNGAANTGSGGGGSSYGTTGGSGIVIVRYRK